MSTLVVYLPVRNHDFVNIDDNVYITENPHIRSGLTLKGIAWAFTTNYASNWHPLTWLSHMIDISLFGMNPAGHHLVNVFFHLANTLLLFWLLRRMTGRRWESGAVAALFALHPLHVESVAWVAERKDVISTLFWLLTMLAYVRYVEHPGRIRYLTAVLTFTLGLQAKPMLVTLPFVLLLLDYWPLKRLSFVRSADENKPSRGKKKPSANPRPVFLRLVSEKTPFFILSFLSCLLTFWAQEGAMGSLHSFPLETRLANCLMSYLGYLEKMFWPVSLAVYYPYSNITAMGRLAVAVALLSGITALAIRYAKQRPYLAVGWFWYLGTLVPVMGLVQVGSQAMADRYTYVPLIGFFLMASYAVSEFLSGWRTSRAIFSLSAGIILSTLFSLTWLQVQHWRDSTALFEHALKVTTNNWMAHNNLGVILADQGKREEAMMHYQKALQIDPTYYDAYNNLGISLVEKGDHQGALEHFSKALKLKPNHAITHHNLGISLTKLERTDEAVRHFQEALRLRPDYWQVHFGLGVALVKEGKSTEAVVHLKEVLKLKPDHTDGNYHLGLVLASRGEILEAIYHLNRVLRKKPDHPEAHYNVGVALEDQGKISEAVTHYQEALRLKPDYAEPHNNLGVILSRQGKAEDALFNFREALRIKPDYAEAYGNLGNVLAGQKKFPEAIRHYSKALQLKPGYVTARYNFGVLLAQQGRIREAIPHFVHVLEIKPRFADARFSLGLAYWMTGNRDSALKEYDALKKLNPVMAEALSRRMKA